MNLANKLTILRIIMIPFFMFFLLIGTPFYDFIAGVIFIIASLTDFLDGYIARSRNMITKFGKFMDPLADKLLVISAFMVFVERGDISSVIVFIIISRELIISIFRAIAAADGIVIAAAKLGKYKTFTQMMAIILLCFNNFPFNYIHIDVANILVYLALILTIASGIEYINKNKDVLKED